MHETTFSKETEAIWNAVERSRPTAVTLAREFAYVYYMAGDLDKASEYIGYLTAGKSRSAVEDDQPDITRLLASLIEYRIYDGEPQRDTLLQWQHFLMLYAGFIHIK